MSKAECGFLESCIYIYREISNFTKKAMISLRDCITRCQHELTPDDLMSLHLFARGFYFLATAQSRDEPEISIILCANKVLGCKFCILIKHILNLQICLKSLDNIPKEDVSFFRGFRNISHLCL